MADDERYKPEWQDFEKRFLHQMADSLEKLNGLPPEIRAKTEDKIRERYRQHEKATAELGEKEPDFYNPSTQGKYTSLVEFLHHDADMMAQKAHESQKAKDLAAEYKDRAENANHGHAGKDHER